MAVNETINVNENRGEQTILFYIKEYGLPYELAQLICKRYKFNKLNIDYFLNNEFRKVINLNNIKAKKAIKVKGIKVEGKTELDIGRIFTTKSDDGRSALLIEIYCNKPFVCQIRPFLIFGQEISNYLFDNLTVESNKYFEDNYVTKLPSNLKNGSNSLPLNKSLSDSLSSLLDHLIKDSYTLNLIDSFINTYFCEIRLDSLSYMEIDKDLFNKNLSITYRKE